MARTWTEEDVLDIARGFQPACILAAAADLDVFTALSDKPMNVEALTQAIGTDLRASRILLDALCVMDLLVKEGQTYCVSADVAALLTDDGSRSILPAVRHLANCLRRWSSLATVVKTGEPAERSPSLRGAQADTDAFIAAMNTFTAPVVDPVIKGLDLATVTHVLDIGGASGNWTAGFLQALPQAHATLFDLPEVIPLARERLQSLALMDRVKLVAGDYNKGVLPGGADLAWLSAIVHQNSREQNRRLYAKICQALNPGGSLVIRDMVMETSRVSPPAGALFAVNMLACTDAGDTFTWAEFEDDLTHAGFTDIKLLVQDQAMDSLIQATKA
jgi:precorrin-6B methylase 2